MIRGHAHEARNRPALSRRLDADHGPRSTVYSDRVAETAFASDANLGSEPTYERDLVQLELHLVRFLAQ